MTVAISPSAQEMVSFVLGQVSRYAGRAAPLAITVLALKIIVTSSIALTRRLSSHVVTDARRYVQQIVENVTRFVSLTLSQISFYMTMAKVELVAVAHLTMGLVATVLGSVFFLWTIVKEAFALYKACHVHNRLKNALAASSDEERAKQGLALYEEALHNQPCSGVEDEKVRAIRVEDQEMLMKEHFGADSYRLLKKAYEESDVSKKVLLLQQAEQFMYVKKVVHALEMAASLVALLATILEFVCPALALIAIVFWTLAATGWISNLVYMVLMERKTEKLLLAS